MRVRDIAAIVVIAHLPLFVGCGEGADPGNPGVQVRDSSGIEIVESGAPIHGRWTVEADPALQIGQADGDPAYLFTQVWDAARASDGRFVVSDGQEYEIRVFAADGTHITTFGREGDGPREFGGPPWIALGSGDTLVVWDPGHYRLSRFDLEGELLTQESLTSTISELSISRFVNGLVWQLRPDGSLLWTGPGESSREEGLHDTTREFTLIDPPEGMTHPFGDFVSGQGFLTRRADGIGIGLRNPFAPTVDAALGPRPYRLAVNTAGIWEVRFLGPTGTTLRILRARIPRTPVTAELLAKERTDLRERVEVMGLAADESEGLFGEFPVPDSLPAIGNLLWDTADQLWVGRGATNPSEVSEYDVFDRDGRWLASTRLPDDVRRILEITADEVLAMSTDELGVQYLRVYSIVKPPE